MDNDKVNKKISKACNRNQLISIRNTDGGVVIDTKPGAFILIKQGMDSLAREKEWAISEIKKTDAEGRVVVDTFKITRTKSGTTKLTINMYPTSSKLVVNGSHAGNKFFTNEMLPRLMDGIRDNEGEAEQINEAILNFIKSTTSTNQQAAPTTTERSHPALSPAVTRFRSQQRLESNVPTNDTSQQVTALSLIQPPTPTLPSAAAKIIPNELCRSAPSNVKSCTPTNTIDIDINKRRPSLSPLQSPNPIVTQPNTENGPHTPYNKRKTIRSTGSGERIVIHTPMHSSHTVEPVTQTTAGPQSDQGSVPQEINNAATVKGENAKLKNKKCNEDQQQIQSVIQPQIQTIQTASQLQQIYQLPTQQPHLTAGYTVIPPGYYNDPTTGIIYQAILPQQATIPTTGITGQLDQISTSGAHGGTQHIQTQPQIVTTSQPQAVSAHQPIDQECLDERIPKGENTLLKVHQSSSTTTQTTTVQTDELIPAGEDTPKKVHQLEKVSENKNNAHGGTQHIQTQPQIVTTSQPQAVSAHQPIDQECLDERIPKGENTLLKVHQSSSTTTQTTTVQTDELIPAGEDTPKKVHQLEKVSESKDNANQKKQSSKCQSCKTEWKGDKMIQCDGCDKWYCQTTKCTGLNTNEYEILQKVSKQLIWTCSDKCYQDITTSTNNKKQYKKELKTQKDQFTLEQNKLKAEIKDKQKEIQNLTQNNARLNKQMEDSNKHAHIKEKARTEQMMDIQGKFKETNILNEKRLKEKQTEVETRESEIQQLRERLKDKTEEANELNKALANATKENNCLKEHITLEKQTTKPPTEAHVQVDLTNNMATGDHQYVATTTHAKKTTKPAASPSIQQQSTQTNRQTKPASNNQTTAAQNTTQNKRDLRMNNWLNDDTIAGTDPDPIPSQQNRHKEAQRKTNHRQEGTVKISDTAPIQQRLIDLSENQGNQSHEKGLKWITKTDEYGDDTLETTTHYALGAMLIGRKGSSIKRFKDQHRVEAKIKNLGHYSNEVTIKFTGTRKNITNARKAFEERFKCDPELCKPKCPYVHCPTPSETAATSEQTPNHATHSKNGLRELQLPQTNTQQTQDITIMEKTMEKVIKNMFDKWEMKMEQRMRDAGI